MDGEKQVFNLWEVGGFEPRRVLVSGAFCYVFEGDLGAGEFATCVPNERFVGSNLEEPHEGWLSVTDFEEGETPFPDFDALVEFWHGEWVD